MRLRGGRGEGRKREREGEGEMAGWRGDSCRQQRSELASSRPNAFPPGQFQAPKAAIQLHVWPCRLRLKTIYFIRDNDGQ